MIRISQLLLIAFTSILVSAACAQSGMKLETRMCVQDFPEDIAANLETREQTFSSALQSLDNAFLPYIVVNRLSKWIPSQTVTVAFKGGNYELRKNIADTAQLWTQHANLVLDFGHNPQNMSFREWTTRDSYFSADIRITFDNVLGYWSLVGTDSQDLNVVRPNQASMSLQYFDILLPQDWQGTVLHEFGHALGFEHEHQHPVNGCEPEFKWYDDTGYIATADSAGQYYVDINGNYPGIYRVYGGPPNNWSRQKIDANFRQLSNSTAYGFGDFDKNSIMAYDLPQWILIRGSASECFIAQQNNSLSERDIEGAKKIYPHDSQEIYSLLQLKRSTLNSLISIESLPDDWRESFTKEIDTISGSL